MSSSIDDALLSIYQEIAGDIVFPMFSGIFKQYHLDLLKAKSSGYSAEEAQAIAIGDFVTIPGLAYDFEPDDSVTVPPPTTENQGVSYLLVPDNFLGDLAVFLGVQPIFRSSLNGLNTLKSLSSTQLTPRKHLQSWRQR